MKHIFKKPRFCIEFGMICDKCDNPMAMHVDLNNMKKRERKNIALKFSEFIEKFKRRGVRRKW